MKGFSAGVFPRGGTADEPALRRWGTRPQRAADASELVGELVLEAFERDLSGTNRGLRHENYAELAGATMPAVHVECGFLTNRDEGTSLSDPSYQEGVAASLALAIQEYRQAVRDGRADAP